MRAIGNKRSACNLIRAVAFVATSLALPGGAVGDDAECEYPVPTVAMLANPDSRAGEFRIVLKPPDYRNAAAVRNHFLFATVWARMLATELAARSKRQCSALMMLLQYPDVHAYLFIDPGGVGVDRSICVRMLQDIIVDLRPRAAEVRNSAEAETSRGMHWFSHRPTWDPLNVVITALTHIYRPGTVMHSLHAVGPRSFRSLDPNAFRAWLEDQWEAGRRIGFRPVEPCSLEGGPQAMRPRAATLPYSSLIPPGIVRIPASDSIGSSPALRHGVIVGHRGVTNGWMFPLVRVVTGKYCGRDLTLAGGEEPGASFPAMVRISCRTDTYDTDAWTLFFCQDCPSRQAVEEAMTTIANDPDIIALAWSHAVNDQQRGPYVVVIEPETEQ